jgi:hypothetical protein
MTSSFASLFTTFLVVTLLLPTINKIMTISSVTNAKQEQKNPSCAVHTADEKTSQLLLRRQALCTATCSNVYTPDYAHQSAFHLEITTDHNPTEISWVLSDGITNQVIHSVEEGDDKYNTPSSFYQQSFFL